MCTAPCTLHCGGRTGPAKTAGGPVLLEAMVAPSGPQELPTLLQGLRNSLFSSWYLSGHPILTAAP